MQRLKHRDRVALFGEVAGTGQSGGTRTDDRHLVTVGSRQADLLPGLVVVPVGDKALQSADADRVALDAAHADLFALVLLRTYPAADSRQIACIGNDVISSVVVALDDLLNKIGDLNVYRTAAHAGTVLAVEAARRLLLCHLLGVALRHLQKVVRTHLGIL